jgi:hypothetical protein
VNSHKAYYTEATRIANSACKLCIADPLHSSLDNGHCLLLVRRGQMFVLELTSDAECPGKLRVERHRGELQDVTEYFYV